MSAFRWKTGNELPEKREVAWLWENFIATGTIALLGGPAGAGKSTLVAALEVAVAGGVPFLDASTLQGEVWHLDFDTDERLQGPWYRKVCAGLGLDRSTLNSLRYLSPADPTRGLGFDELAELEQVVRLGGPVLLVIDAWSSAFFYADSKKAEHVAEVMLRLRQIAALGPAVVVLDHSPKPVQGLGALERGVAGSFYKLGGARAAYLMQRIAPRLTGGRDILRFDCLKNNLAPIAEPLGIARYFEPDSLRFELTDLPDDEMPAKPGLTRAVRSIREVLGEGPLLRAELIGRVAERANVAERTTTEALRLLRESGEVKVEEVSGRGSPALYRLRAPNAENLVQDSVDLAQNPLPQMFALNGNSVQDNADLAQSDKKGKNDTQDSHKSSILEVEL